MEKIYGYKQSETKKLIEFIKKRKGESLTKLFSDFSALSGKSKGTVRNMYYAIVKKSNNDQEFCIKNFDGIPLKVQKIDKFCIQDEKSLVKQIIIGVNENRSVRSVIDTLSGGDATLALRYQNKYRNLCTRYPEAVKEILAELNAETGENYTLKLKRKTTPVSKFQLKKLQAEIDGLLARITEKYKKENGCLLTRIAELEMENSRLKNLIFGGTSKEFFLLDKDETIC